MKRTAENKVIPREEIPGFMTTQGVKPLITSREVYPGAGTIDWTSSPYYLNNKAVFERLAGRYAQGFQAGLAPVELRFIAPEVGWGLFAAQPLGRLAWVGEYAGVVDLASDDSVLEQVDGHFATDYAWNYPDELPDGRILEINALKEGNALRYVNHSFTPNLSPDHMLLEGRWVTFFRTRRKIAAGEQLTVDYGEEYWSSEHRTLVLFD